MKKTSVLAALTAGVLVDAQSAPAPKAPGPAPTNMPKSLGKGPVPFGPAPSGCSKYEILIARGTTEPGPFGVIAGDPLVARVTKQLPDARGYAVQYPADAGSNSSNIGAADVVKRLKQQTAACPGQTFALTGYSQGASVMRKAAKLADFDPKWYDKIVALVMYGDPGQRVPSRMPTSPFPEALHMKLKENCAKGDPACDSNGGNDFGPHLTYNSKGTTWQDDSAAFIVAGFKGQSLPKVNNEPH